VQALRRDIEPNAVSTSAVHRGVHGRPVHRDPPNLTSSEVPLTSLERPRVSQLPHRAPAHPHGRPSCQAAASSEVLTACTAVARARSPRSGSNLTTPQRTREFFEGTRSALRASQPFHSTVDETSGLKCLQARSGRLVDDSSPFSLQRHRDQGQCQHYRHDDLHGAIRYTQNLATLQRGRQWVTSPKDSHSSVTVRHHYRYRHSNE
jgi:hypothetical protein